MTSSLHAIMVAHIVLHAAPCTQAEAVLRIAADSDNIPIRELKTARLLWLDRFGVYLYQQVRIHRFQGTPVH